MKVETLGDEGLIRLVNLYSKKLEDWNFQLSENEKKRDSIDVEFRKIQPHLIKIIDRLIGHPFKEDEITNLCARFSRSGGELFDRHLAREKLIQLTSASLRASQIIGDKHLEILHTGYLGNSMLFTSRSEDAISYFEKAIGLLEMSLINDRDKLMATFHGNLAIAYFQVGVVHSAIINSEKQAEFAKKSSNQILESYAYLNLSLYYKKIGKLEKAKGYAELYLSMTIDLKDARGESFAYNSLGNIYAELGQVETALNYHQKSLEIKRLRRDYYGSANSLLNIGIAYRDLEQYFEAIDCLDEGIKLVNNFGASKDERVLCKLLGNKAVVLRKQGRFQEAISLHEEEMIYAERTNDRFSISFSLLNKGLTLKEERRYADAKEHLKEALQIAQQIDDIRSIASATLALSQVSLIQEDFQGAIGFCEMGLSYLDEETLPELRLEFNLALREIENKRKLSDG